MSRESKLNLEEWLVHQKAEWVRENGEGEALESEGLQIGHS